MLLSLSYLVVRGLLQLATLRCCSDDFKALEIIIVLRHELAILRRRTRRPVMTTVDRLFLAAASRVLPRAAWRSFIVTPATLLQWHRRLVAKRWMGSDSGRPLFSDERDPNIVDHGYDVLRYAVAAREPAPTDKSHRVVGTGTFSQAGDARASFGKTSPFGDRRSSQGQRERDPSVTLLSRSVAAR